MHLADGIEQPALPIVSGSVSVGANSSAGKTFTGRVVDLAHAIPPRLQKHQ